MRHGNVRLGAEILDDDFLNVAVSLVQTLDGEQRIDPIFEALANTDKNAGGEGHAEPAGVFDGLESQRREFVRGIGVRAVDL